MSAPFDLTTLAGIEACLMNSILPAFKNAFDEAGAFGMAAAIIATRFEGKGLASPRSVVILSAKSAAEFLPGVYCLAEHEYLATGVITVGMAWTAPIETETEANAWRGRSLQKHPRGCQVMLSVLEHKRLGVHSWQSRVVEEGGRRVVGPPQAVTAVRPDRGYLDYAGVLN